MKLVFFVTKEKYGAAKNKVYTDDVVARQSIILREASALGLSGDGYYLQIDGSDAALKKAKEILSTDAKELKGKEAENVKKAIDEQESNAAAGFGAIFG